MRRAGEGLCGVASARRSLASAPCSPRQPVIRTCTEVPPVLRHAILSAEDKHFFTHSGVDYRVLPRVLQKTAARSLAAWGTGDAGSGCGSATGARRSRSSSSAATSSTNLTRREGADVLIHRGLMPRLLSTVVGVPATNKLLRKLEEVCLALWLEAEMRQRYGSPERAKREIFARYASFVYLGHGRYGFAQRDGEPVRR